MRQFDDEPGRALWRPGLGDDASWANPRHNSRTRYGRIMP